MFPKCNQSRFIIFRSLSAVTLGIGVTVWNLTAKQTHLLGGIPISHSWQAMESRLGGCVYPAGAAFFICYFFPPLPQKSSLIFFSVLHKIGNVAEFLC